MADSTQTTPRVVIAGPAASGKKSIVSGVASLSSNNTLGSATVSPTSICINGTDLSSYSLSLSTKYYDADISFVVLPSSEFSEPSSISKSALEGAEGLILVLDASEKEHIAQLKVWGEVLAEGGPSCMLCVVNKCDVAGAGIPGLHAQDEDGDAEGEGEGGAGVLAGGTVSTTGNGYGQGYGSINEATGDEAAGRQKAAARAAAIAAVPREHKEYVSKVQDWCLDHGLECVECVATQHAVGAQARDKVGVPRILEALQSTMWSNMRRKQPSRRPLLGEELSSSGNEYSTGVALSGSATQEGYEAPTLVQARRESSNDSLAAELESMRVQAAISRGDVFEASDTSTQPQTAGVSADPLQELESAAAEPGAHGDDDGEEFDVGAMMAQMMQVRQAAQAGGLTDEQRREAAAQMALKLLRLMGEDADPEELLRAAAK